MDTGQQRQLEEVVSHKYIYRRIRKVQMVDISNALPGCLLGEGEQYISENGRQ